MNQTAVPNLSGTKDQFRGRQFSIKAGYGWRNAGETVPGDSSKLHLLCTLFLLLLCTLLLHQTIIRCTNLNPFPVQCTERFRLLWESTGAVDLAKEQSSWLSTKWWGAVGTRCLVSLSTTHLLLCNLLLKGPHPYPILTHGSEDEAMGFSSRYTLKKDIKSESERPDETSRSPMQT